MIIVTRTHTYLYFVWIYSYADDDSRKFAEMFSEVYAPKLLEPIMQVISLTPNGRFCTDRCTHLAYVYLESAVQLKNTYAMLKPHMKSLLFDIVFPRLCISEADAQLFDSDPVEYVRKFNDNMEDFNDPKVF
jgi:importin-7